MAWLILFLAGVLEIGWAVGLKYAEGLTRPLITLVTVASGHGHSWYRLVRGEREPGAAHVYRPHRRRYRRSQGRVTGVRQDLELATGAAVAFRSALVMIYCFARSRCTTARTSSM
jgi:Small Multidrug Resistance (SMR) protein